MRYTENAAMGTAGQQVSQHGRFPPSHLRDFFWLPELKALPMSDATSLRGTFPREATSSYTSRTSVRDVFRNAGLAAVVKSGVPWRGPRSPLSVGGLSVNAASSVDSAWLTV